MAMMVVDLGGGREGIGFMTRGPGIQSWTAMPPDLVDACPLGVQNIGRIVCPLEHDSMVV